MKRVVFIWLCLFHQCLFSKVPVLNDFNKAEQLAQLYNKPLMLVFTDCQWSLASQKICDELFEQDQFSHSVGNAFIFVHIDYSDKEFETASQKQKIALKNQYQVTAFPTLVMVEPDGQEITRLNYQNQDLSQFALSLKHLFSKFSYLKEEITRTDFSTADEGKLKALYEEAVEIRCPTFISQLLEEGLKLDQGAFFPVEKYSQLILEGKGDSPEGQELKEKVIQRDRDNHQGARLRLALLDFQSHQDNPDEALKEPLSYIEDLGKSEDDNLWRLHMVISDYFAEHGKLTEAKKHAEESLQAAPEEVRKDLVNIDPSASTEKE